jgi:hypothetical protein
MRPISRALALSLCVFGLAVTALPARADLTPVTNPTVIFTGPGTEFYTDVAFDSVNKVYMATWGTFEARPCLGRFLDVNGAPIGGVFTLSDGASQCGWTRVSAGGGRFLVTFSKRVGGTDRAPIKYQMARFITFNAGQPSFASAEIFIDNTVDIDSDGGNAYNPATGNFMVTWFKNRAFPQSFVRRVSPDGTTGDVVQLTDNSDGLPEPEIACNPTSNICVTVGVSFDAAHNGAGATWMRTIDGTTGAPTGPMTLLDAGILQENQSVAYSAASGQFVLAWVRLRQRIVGYLVSGTGVPSGGQYAIKSPFDTNCNVAFGQMVSSLRYNSATSTSALAMVNNCGVAYIQELDASGAPTANSFQPITGLGTTDPQPSIAANTVDGQFLGLHNYHYATPYSRVFQAQLHSDGGGGNPPPPPPPTTIDLDPANTPNGSWFLAEGAANPVTNGFKTFYLIENPNTVDVSVRAYFSSENGTAKVKTFTIASQSRTTVPLFDTVGGGSFGTVFQSLTPGADIAVERSMYWGPNLEGSTDATAVNSLSKVWYFAEGSRGGELFNNYFLLFNPTQTATVVTGHYYRADGQVFGHTYNVGPQQRYTVDANAIPELAGADFSATFTSDNTPFVAERSMYWNWQGPTNWWIGGHATMGSPTLAVQWYFAEGNAAPNFESFFLLLNSNPFPITVTGDFMTEFNGRQIRQYAVPAQSRVTVYLNGEFGNVGPTGVAFSAPAGSWFLAERSIYWGNRVEGTNTIGAPLPAAVWDLPEGSTGNAFDTYEMVMNPTANPVDINVTLFIEGFGAFTLPPGTVPTLPAFSRRTLVMKDVLAQLAQVQGIPPGVKTSSFSTRISTTNGARIVVEHAVYWNFVDGITYWRSGGGSMGIPRF